MSDLVALLLWIATLCFLVGSIYAFVTLHQCWSMLWDIKAELKKASLSVERIEAWKKALEDYGEPE